jgi:DNA invertase Pin-like site-specific DNA recombinase
METGKVYSYLRFSDPKQAAGSSADRQLQYAQRWAADRGLPLDSSLSLRDEGLSAYHQRHVKQGALGVFLLAVDEGRIQPGSYLVVEGLDRLSRAEPIQAQAQLAQIINAGITVVTASDGREYNRDGLKAQPMDLVYSLLVMIRAHEESDTKSKRVKAAVRRQCEGWIAGTYRGIIRNGKDPHWVRWNGREFELVPDRAEAVRLAITMFRHGHGGNRIIHDLHRRGLQLSDTGSTKSSLYKILRRKDLVGTKTLVVGGEEYNLDGYYPCVISNSEFGELQVANTSRIRHKGKGEIPGLVTGVGVLYCGYCGSAVLGQNIMTRGRKPDGTLQDGHRRIICGAYNTGHGCKVGGSCSVVPVEKAILNYCSDQFNLSSIMNDNGHAQAIRASVVRLTQRIADMEKQLERLTNALMVSKDDDGSPPQVFIRKAKDLEVQIASAHAEQISLEVQLRKLSSNRTPALAVQWASLAKGVLMLDYEVRITARQLIKDTFERIVLYHRGIEPANSSGKMMDLLLVAKGGQSRLLRINRKSAEWVAGEEITTALTSSPPKLDGFA